MKLPPQVIPVLAAVAMLTACGSTSPELVCPPYPFPSGQVIQELQSLDSDAVNQWVVKQKIIAEQLELCK